MLDLISQFDLASFIDFIDSPSFRNFQLGVIIYIGLLWLSVIIWVTRDAIHRSDSLIFQVISILLNIAFPILGVLLYLIIRPSKTSIERYYEALEHRLILDAIEDKKTPTKKTTKKSIPKTKKKTK